jgi:hypothetical protein
LTAHATADVAARTVPEAARRDLKFGPLVPKRRRFNYQPGEP